MFCEGRWDLETKLAINCFIQSYFQDPNSAVLFYCIWTETDSDRVGKKTLHMLWVQSLQETSLDNKAPQMIWSQ